MIHWLYRIEMLKVSLVEIKDASNPMFVLTDFCILIIYREYFWRSLKTSSSYLCLEMFLCLSLLLYMAFPLFMYPIMHTSSCQYNLLCLNYNINDIIIHYGYC